MRAFVRFSTLLTVITALAIIPIFAQSDMVDLIMAEVGTDVVVVDDFTYELVVSGVVIQQDGYVPVGMFVFETDWDLFEYPTELDDGETYFERSFIVPENYLGQTITVSAEIWPMDGEEVNDADNHRLLTAFIPAPPGEEPILTERSPEVEDPDRQPQGNNGDGFDWPELPDIEIPLNEILLAAAGLVALGLLGRLMFRPRVNFKANLTNLEIRATEQPPQNPQKGQYWVERELAVRPTRWKLTDIAIETEPKSIKRKAPKQMVEVISHIIDQYKRRRQEDKDYWEYAVYDEFVDVAYPIKANFAWLDATIKQMNLTVTFTIYRYTGSQWRKLLSKDFSRRGTYHYILPLQSFPQNRPAAMQEINQRLSALIEELVSWPFKGS